MTVNYYLARVKFTTLSSTLDNPSIDLAYIATDAPADANDLATKVANAMTTAAVGQVVTLSGYLGPSISRGAGTGVVQVYNITGHLDGTPHGSPVATVAFTPSTLAAGTQLPEGVCANVGLVANYGSDVEFGPSAAIPTPPDIIADFAAAATHVGRTRLRQRDRGRFSFGPLATNAIAQETTTNRCKLSTQIQGDIQLAVGKLLVQPVLTSSTAQLGVWSRRNVSVKPATSMHLADRPGYQRRRADSSTVILVQAIPF